MNLEKIGKDDKKITKNLDSIFVEETVKFISLMENNYNAIFSEEDYLSIMIQSKNKSEKYNWSYSKNVDQFKEILKNPINSRFFSSILLANTSQTVEKIKEQFINLEDYLLQVN